MASSHSDDDSRDFLRLLNESEDRFRQMAELTPLFVWVSRPDGSLEFVNQRWTEYSGLDLAATADFTRLAASIHPDESDLMFARWAQSVAAGTPFELEARLRRRDGEFRWFIVRTLPLRDAGGVIVRWFGASVDIHDHKLAEAALRASEQRLREAHEQLEERVRQRTNELNQANQLLVRELSDRRAAQDRIAGLLTQLTTIQEEERRRVARELHDQLGQPMTALRMHLEALRLRTVTPELIEPLGNASVLAEELDRGIDFLTWQMRPSTVDDLGIADALTNLVDTWSSRFHVAATCETDGLTALRLPADVETHVYRIVQEALHNVHKHAGATRVVVTLRRHEGKFSLRVSDNGGGIGAAGGEYLTAGMGLSNMRDRATLAGGDFFVFWSRTGTTIELRLPDSIAQTS